MSGKIQNLLKEAESATDGKSSVHKAEREFKSVETAAQAFAALRRKLLHVNRWEKFSSVSGFDLYDANGQSLAPETMLREGNFIRITLAGSGKHDWVRAEEIHDASDEFVITVRPAHDPTDKENDKSVTSHFFTDESINNFCLEKKNMRVTIYVIGLYEKPNIDQTDSIIESARNAATAAFGFLGLQKIEWQTFCENFLKMNNG